MAFMFPRIVSFNRNHLGTLVPIGILYQITLTQSFSLLPTNGKAYLYFFSISQPFKNNLLELYVVYHTLVTSLVTHSHYFQNYLGYSERMGIQTGHSVANVRELYGFLSQLPDLLMHRQFKSIQHVTTIS